MVEKINEIIDEIEEEMIAIRRDFHQYPESAWTEFRTASMVARKLKDMGYSIKLGKEVMNEKDRMGVPHEEQLEKHYKRALDQGADREFVEKLKGGFTGVVGLLDCGDGPIVALRFDMDAVEVGECKERAHFPYKEGFASVNENVMHACGHDGHTTIGLAVAKALMGIKDQLKGKIKLIFQPAEEGVRGAKSMTTSGILDDVDIIMGGHIGIKAKGSGMLFCGTSGFLATSKFDAYFKGISTHAGATPEKGKNALLAAASAAMNLHAIPRHSEGFTRINVGKLVAGTGRNVIPSNAHMLIETRGENSELNEYMRESAKRILKNAAEMYDVDLDLQFMGAAESGESDEELIVRAKGLAEKLDAFQMVTDEKIDLGGSEDFAYMMKKVQSQGGKAIYMLFGSDIKDDHHNSKFDFDEKDLKGAAKIFSLLVHDLLKRG
ncbi:amidohydrolase [Crassaminicella profunda]|uniref:amidohydrolase n=1 Tax=Crassaminicella profunda TaxID=1286698 RepID=UPI001CA64026|nr:amidohydrolase [Crassaminicella profunda]QZY54121.1 amidohydrolase [Crassaminicella profunda]